jgi:hypothetical protein
MIKENIAKQKELLRYVAQSPTQTFLYEAIHDLRQKRSERDYIPIFHPYRPTAKMTDAPESSTVGKRKERKTARIIVTPLSHRGGARPSSSQTLMPTAHQTTAQPDFIDLVTPSPPPTRRIPSPMPPHMKNEKCHICGEIGHFGSYCPSFTCNVCKKPAPKHYPSKCPRRLSHSPAPPSYHQQERDFDDDDGHFDFDDEAIANMTGEPVGYRNY